MSTIAKIIDQWGWAYYFVGIEQQRYSKHKITIQRHDDLNFDNHDAVYIHGPDITKRTTNLPRTLRGCGLKFIGGHAGEIKDMQVYADIDLAVGISPETYQFCKQHYTCPTVFLPEGIDTNYFVPGNKQPTEQLVVGWAGRKDRVKRTHLLEQLNVPVVMKSDHTQNFLVPNRSSQPMLDFYHTLDAFVLTSISECMPRVVLEACACGLPVISTDVGSLKMILQPEWLVPAFPEENVVPEINVRLEALKDPVMRKQVGDRNRRWVDETLSWEWLSQFWDQAFTAAITGNFDCVPAINNFFGMS